MNRWIPFDEIVNGDEVGRGNYGAVRKGTYHGTKVAIKELYPDDSEIVKYFQREVSMLSAARHPNIVEFLGISKTPEGNFLIVTEYCELMGDLHQVLQRGNVGWKERVEIAFAIAKAMSFLHGRGIIHRDLKCENILLTTTWEVKVCDFGFARKMDRAAKQMTICGTDWTMAPEIIMENIYNEKADVFSYGMVLAEILSGVAPDMKNFTRQMPDFGIDPNEILQKAEAGAPEKFVNLAMDCVHLKGHDRPSFVDIVQALQEVLLEEGYRPKSHARTVSMVGISGQVLSEMDNVFITRIDSRNTEGEPVYLYQVTNKRANDVMVCLEMTGGNSALTPLGTAESISEGKIVEGIVRKGQEVLLGQVEAIDPTQECEFSCSVQVERSDSEIREDEAQGVILITTIEHGYTRQVSFYIHNPKEFDIQAEISVDGKFLSASCEVPIKKIVPSGQKLFMGSLKINSDIGTSWGWAQIPKKATDLVAVVKGVHLIRKPVAGVPNKFQVVVTNSRRRAVNAIVTLQGDHTGATTNPLEGVVRPNEEITLGTFVTNGEVMMDFQWKEL